MATKFRIPFRKAVVVQDLPTGTAAGAKINDPVRINGLNGVNLWGTGAGQGIPAGSDYGVIATDGVIVTPVVVTTAALTEGSPVYITSGNVLNNTASGNTLFGYADEPAAVGTRTIGVRISNAI